MAVSGALFCIYKAIEDTQQSSGWVQNALVFVGLPVIFYQIYEIRKDLNNAPSFDFGIASIKDYPISKIKTSKFLKSKIEIQCGYAHFLLAIRNTGKIIVKNVKVFLEFTRTSPDNIGLYAPKLIISEFSKNKKGFVSENNVEFTFTGGSDFSIYPGDTETFGFHFITVVMVKDKSGTMNHEYPDPCTCHLKCTIWAEGNIKPSVKDFDICISGKVRLSDIIKGNVDL